MSVLGNAVAGQNLKGRINAVDILTISAYGIAVKNGFKGTEEEWLKSLEANPETIQQFVNEYLEQNPTTVDTTLTKLGESADAKATGLGIAEAKKIAQDHKDDKENPHNVTKAQLGLGNVDNTSDANKPVSTAQATAIADAKKAGTDAQTTANEALEIANNAKPESIAYTKEQVIKASPRNFLVNSNFLNPVNYQGKTSFNSIDEAFAGWRVGTSNLTVTIKSDGVETSADSTGTGILHQQIPEDVSEYMNGKVFTIAVCQDDGTILTTSGVCKSDTVSSNTSMFAISSEDGKWYLNLYKLKSTQQFNFRINTRAGCICKFRWAALYEGEYTADTLPRYQSKGYMAEALDCGVLNVKQTATLSASNWSSSAPYTQTVSIDGITVEDNPHISPVYSDTLATALAQKEAWEMVSRAKTGANSITFYCFEDKPTTDIPVQIEVNR